MINPTMKLHPATRLRTKASGPRNQRGFSLVELLVASTIIVLLCGILIQMTSITSRIWVGNKARIEQFSAAHNAFEAMTRRISQATLNTYWDYDNPAAVSTPGAIPAKFIRQSELRFTCGQMTDLIPNPARKWAAKGIFFHAPLGFIDRSKPDLRGMDNLLNTWGYFVEFGDDSETRPTMLSPTTVPLRYRFRLMEFMLPGDNVSTYSLTSGLAGTTPRNLLYSSTTWFSSFLNVGVGAKPTRPVHALAENVVAMTFIPKLAKADEERRSKAGQAPLCADFKYDTYYSPSRAYPDPEINPSNQLPPIVQVTMVAIDEGSAINLASTNGAALPVLGSGLFKDTRKLFDDPGTPTAEDGDLSKLGAELAKQHLNYRVFSTDVTIRSAKWSREQK